MSESVGARMLVARCCLATWCAATLLFAGWACGKDGTGPNPVARVHVGPDDVRLLLGHTAQLTVTLYDANGSRLSGRPVTWYSDDPTKITVTADGVVTAANLSDGVVIFAESEGIKGSTIVLAVIDLSGEWNWVEQGTVTFYGEAASTCEAAGSFRFLETSTGFRGWMTQIATCVGPLSSVDLSTLWPDSLRPIELSGTFIRFEDPRFVDAYAPGCRWQGTVTSTQSAKLSGSIECEVGVGGVYRGTWQATRGGSPIATIEVRWDVATVPGGAAQLIAVPRDATGNVLQRPVTWSSDNRSVARVDETGLVTALAAGAAHITATSEGRSGSGTVTVEAVTLNSSSVGRWNSCALASNGRPYCWGWGSDGQLGIGVRPFALAPSETQRSPRGAAGGYTFLQIDVGHRGHACGVTSAFEAYCWGDNTWGQVGDGSVTHRLAPTKVAGGELYKSVSAGAMHTCGLALSGTVLCWGYNLDGQLGTGGTANTALPTPVSGSLQFRSISAGEWHTCGIATDSTAYCWGFNGWGRLGDGTTRRDSTVPLPVPVGGGHKFAVVVASGWLSCGIAVDSTAYCWGDNYNGALGNGEGGHRSTPTAVSGGQAFVALAVGHTHACALTASGAAYCWGYNAYGQLGDGTNENRSVPVHVSGSVPFATIAAAGWHTCASTAAGATWCWGVNEDGQLGAQTTGLCHVDRYDYRCSSAPVHVQGQVGVTRTLASVRVASPPASSQRLPSPRAPALRQPGGNTSRSLNSPRLH